jgi:hypothetical protein
MQRMPYRGYTIQSLWKADNSYVVHIFPQQQGRHRADRKSGADGYPEDIRVTTDQGTYIYFDSVTRAMEAGKGKVDELLLAAR